MRISLLRSIRWPDGSEQSGRYGQASTQVCQADEFGLHSAWPAEHRFGRHGIVALPRTRQARVGTAVAVLSLPHPERSTGYGATADQVRGMRIGHGHQPGGRTGSGVDSAHLNLRLVRTW